MSQNPAETWGIQLSLRNLFADRFGLREQVQIIRAAGFGVGSRHIEAAEGMRTYDRSRALAVDVQVADVELLHGAFNLRARTGVDGAGQAKLGIVGDLERMIVVPGLDHCQYRPENLFLFELGFRLDVGNHGRLDKVALAGLGIAS